MVLVKELIRRGFLVRNQPAPSPLPTSASDDAIPSHGKKRSIGSASDVPKHQAVLFRAMADVERIKGDLQVGHKISSADMTLYRYYCEAVLVFKHLQLPGAVEDFTDAEWVGRVIHSSRVVLRTTRKASVGMRVALSQAEEDMLQQYYLNIRPHIFREEKGCNRFFLTRSGDAVHSVSMDMSKLHSIYKMAISKSQDVRRAVMADARLLSAHQQEAIQSYLGCSAGAALDEDLVEAADLLSSMAGTCSDEGTAAVAEISKRCSFNQFLEAFPVSPHGQPPSKRQRSEAGFPGARSFYDKWRASQYTKRADHLVGYFSLRRPSAAKVARLIAQEGWTTNCPKPEEVVKIWRPASKQKVETDPFVQRCVAEQAWTGLAIKDFGPPKGFGVVATRNFASGDIVCDYHGNVITASEGRSMMAGLNGEAGYLFFFKSGDKSLCVDAQTFPCSCHPQINHSSKAANVKPFSCKMTLNGQEKDIVLFKAMRNITVDEELKFDYGVNRKSFRGEGLDLEWLED